MVLEEILNSPLNWLYVPGHSKHILPTTQEDSMHGHHQMVSTKIRLTIFFAVKDGQTLHNQEKTLYNQQKQDQDLTVA